MGNRRTSPQVSVDAHVPCRTTQTLALSIRYVLLCLGITILLCHTKVHDVYHWYRVNEPRVNAMNERRAPFAALVPGRPTRKLSGLISR